MWKESTEIVFWTEDMSAMAAIVLSNMHIAYTPLCHCHLEPYMTALFDYYQERR